MLKSDSKKSFQSEALEKIKSSFEDDNLNETINLLECGKDSDFHLIGSFANNRLSDLHKKTMKSNNLMELYQNLFILRTAMSFDFINNGITESLKLSNSVKSKIRSMVQFFPLEFKNKAKINPLCEIFQNKLFILIKNKDTEGIQNFLNEMNFILLNSSSSVKDDKVKLFFYYDRENLKLTFLPRKEDYQNIKAAEIVYETVSNSETFTSYNEFLDDFKNKLKEQLQMLYRFHLENAIDPDSGFITDGSHHVFLSNIDAVKNELISILNRNGLHSGSFSLEERVKIAELISEILTKQN